jgi:transcriptional regulator with XRE-family HTH domain
MSMPAMVPSLGQVTVNALQQLIVERMRERGWSYSDVGNRGGIPRSTVHQLATKDIKRVPKFETIEGLAKGLQYPLRVVWDAAAQAVGAAGLQHLYRERSKEAEMLIAHYEELSPERRTMLMALLETLRRSQDANGEDK